jgi:hypothetical protein
LVPQEAAQGVNGLLNKKELRSFATRSALLEGPKDQGKTTNPKDDSQEAAEKEDKDSRETQGFTKDFVD